MLNVVTVGIDKMIDWHQQFMGKQFIVNGKLNRQLIQETGAPSKYGMDTIDKVINEQSDSSLKP